MASSSLPLITVDFALYVDLENAEPFSLIAVFVDHIPPSEGGEAQCHIMRVRGVGQRTMSYLAEEGGGGV